MMASRKLKSESSGDLVVPKRQPSVAQVVDTTIATEDALMTELMVIRQRVGHCATQNSCKMQSPAVEPVDSLRLNGMAAGSVG